MRTYIIADIGINHNGNLSLAKKLINIASFAGADCVKFQKRNPDVCVPEDQKLKIRETPWGSMSYIDYRWRVEFGKDDYDEIDKCCVLNDIKWSCSVWDIDSLMFLNKYDVPFIKIPSAMLTDLDLLKLAKEEALKKEIKIIVSTGMSTLEEIDNAVNVLRGSDFAVLHCNSSYPASVKDLNLSCIKTYKKRYNCEVGYSGHEYRTGTTVSTVYLGATIIERHVTLDRTMWGSDQFASLEPEGLITMVRAVRDLENALGDGIKKVSKEEKDVRRKLRR